ncbi:hypothetical protein [Streptomyces sp. A5-4]|uniref:hypothetical protein n=1 Tax=Streptomyces sp. A5-4 TaxID=3384771 RepID=UPI003DA9BB1A
MSRISVHTVDSAPEQSCEALRVLEKRFGKLLDIHAEMAHSPVVLTAYAAMSDAIAEHGTFDARAREAGHPDAHADASDDTGRGAPGGVQRHDGGSRRYLRGGCHDV